MNDRITEERRYKKMLQRIRGFRLLDDDFMTKCFEENIEATELVLRIILNKSDIKVVKVQTQYSMKNIKGRSLRLDIYATEPEDMNFKVLAKATSYYKKDKQGIQAMCKAMEDMITDEKKLAAIRMLERGKLTQEEIAEDLELELEVVEELANHLQTV